MATVADQRSRPWTYEEYARLDDEQRYEIIKGELLMAPAPDMYHQEWAGELYQRIVAHVRAQRLGKVYFAPVDVVFDAQNVVQPDLLFIASANLSIIKSGSRFRFVRHFRS
jgi:Uma2 family endonuclease